MYYCPRYALVYFYSVDKLNEGSLKMTFAIVEHLAQLDVGLCWCSLIGVLMFDLVDNLDNIPFPAMLCITVYYSLIAANGV